MGQYKSFCVLMYSNGTLWVLISHYTSLSVVMGLYKSLCLLMGFMGPSRSLCVLMDPFGFLRFLLGSFCPDKSNLNSNPNPKMVNGYS